MPRPVSPADVEMWVVARGDALGAVFTGAGDPDPMVETRPVEGVVTPNVSRDGGVIVHVPWQLDEIDLACLANGGTLWLSTWGGLPPHELQVVAR